MASSKQPPQPPTTLSHVPPIPSYWQKYRMTAILFRLFLRAVPTFIFAILLSRDFSSRNIKRTLQRVAARLLPAIPLPYLLSNLKPTGTTVAAECAKSNTCHRYVTVPVPPVDSKDTLPPAVLHFIGTDPATASTPKKKQTLLLYFHGGGYIFPAQGTQVAFAQLLARSISEPKAPGHATQLVLLEYTLAPGLCYPGQLAQASAALSHLISDEGYLPENIVIAGDSGGGNLCLALLAHLHKPMKEVAPVCSGSDGKQVRLKGALPISPRCSNDATADSYVRNRRNDVITPSVLDIFTSNWKPRKEEVYATPLAGDETFWQGVVDREKGVVGKVLVVTGEDEVYVDDIAELAEKMGAVVGSGEIGGNYAKKGKGARVRVEVCRGEIHTQAVIDVGLKIDDGIMLFKVLEWAREL